MRQLILTTLALATALHAQNPRIANARFETKAAGSLSAEIQSAIGRNTPLWLGYAVERTGDGESCCYSNGQVRGCSLEGNRGVSNAAPQGPIQLEASKYAMVLYRIETGAIGKIRFFSLDCDLDAGGLPFIWLTGVKPTESLQVLRSNVGPEKRADSAIAAIAMHAVPEADTILEDLLKPDQSIEIRRKAVFWMGNQRGRRGVETLKRVVREDPSEKVREHAVFALSHSKDPEGLQTVMRIAKEDKSADVRSKALFWLAQKAGQKAIGSISSAIEDDPDTKVKRQAVFALTQLPNNEGVPALIKVARENRNPAVRKQAFFWLGQSKDQRAVQFLEEVLTR